MKRYKVRQIIRFLEKDGWRLRNCKGDHRQYVHPEKSGKVTVRGKPSDNLDQFLLNSIWKQAGWKELK
ncbi:MAG: type II toxin-antitoxin system HicA family toxin [Bacteroidales bacterium]|nr:type II toxin-antitoxin system HicA family toxin [Bacteroidales bacterium]